MACLWSPGRIMIAQSASDTGGVNGIVIEAWEGKPLPGVTVTVRGTLLATVTDAQGRYALNGVLVGDHVLRFSKSGYASAVVTDVRVAAGQSTKVDGNLRPEFYELEEYVVTAEEFQEQTAALLQERQDSAAMLDAIGAEQFSRLAASDAADIVSRVPGITVSEGKNPVVRGLNERYVGVTLNGAEVPSADPYKKSAQLDMFPAGLIQTVVVNKSFTPDMPGNFTGGGVNVETRSFPEKFTLTAGVSTEFNTAATFRDDFPSYTGGATDWAGIDDGSRALPAAFAQDSLRIPRPVTSSGLPTSPTFQSRVEQANQLDAFTKALGPAEFAPRATTAPPNHGFNFSLGNTLKLGEAAVGYFGGVTYRRNFNYQEGISRRYVPGLNQQLSVRKDFEDIRGITDANWAAVANLALRLNDRHEFNFNFLFNQNAEDTARIQSGSITDDPGYVFVQNRLHWIERNLTTFQLRGKHEIPSLLGLKLDWLGALSQTTQDEPDARFFNYRTDGGSFEPDHQSLPTPNKPTRYFRELDEGNRNLKLDLTLPFRQWSGLDSEVKMGGYDSTGTRDFIDREIYYEGLYGTGDAFPFAGDPNAFLPPGSLGYTSTTNNRGAISYTWNRYLQSRESTYTGDQAFYAGYFMTELPLFARLKMVGGARYETTLIEIASRSYQANETTGLTVNQSKLDEAHWLPAASLIYTVITNMHVRAGYSETLARPTFRELAAYRSYDPVTDEILEGNPRLDMSTIVNYDLRWEWFPKPGDVLAVSLFYKELTQAIERRFLTISGDIVSFLNRPDAKVYGVELEFRRGLGFISDALEDTSVGFNASIMESEVQLTPEEIANRIEFLGDPTAKSPLYDQSPYIINLDISQSFPSVGTTATLGFNVFGPRIVIAGLSTPDVYEQSIPQLDFVVNQKLGKHWKLRFSAKNLLDPAIERTYGENGGQALYSSYQKGRAFGLSVSYEF